MEHKELTFPAIELKVNKNGKINASAELWFTVITENDAETLATYTVKDFADAVIKHYGITTSDANGACAFLRGMVNGSKLDFSFEFSDARPASKLTTLQKENDALQHQNNAMRDALIKAGYTDEAIAALLK